MSLTATQKQAVKSRGNVLLMAGAGTGKTHTLVERCLDCLLDAAAPASLEEILVVTFTEAAAVEVKQRIRSRLEQECRSKPGQGCRAGGAAEPDLEEQLGLFENAFIGTLHGFCLQLVREHFFELELDPQLSVVPEEEARLLAEETMDALFAAHYEGTSEQAMAVQDLLLREGTGGEKQLRNLLLRVHHYTQTLADPAGWLEAQAATFGSADPAHWRAWLRESLADWPRLWQPLLEDFPENEVAVKCLAALKAFAADPEPHNFPGAAVVFERAVQGCRRGKKTEWVKPLQEFLDEAVFLRSLVAEAGQPDPLAEDWDWARQQMAALVQMAREFAVAFAEAKRQLAVVDFHDLEQFALRLLWDPVRKRPTPVAAQWREKFRFVFVDEYQDINAAQDKIIEMLSRDGQEANRFLVGDVKQSIYRFRLADPHIFQRYAATWPVEGGEVIPLVENFRSREGVLAVVNAFFGLWMRTELGGVPYDESARLQFGAPESRSRLGVVHDPDPRVELHLQLDGPGEDVSEEATDRALKGIDEMEDAAKEARLVALQLRRLREQAHAIWDKDLGGFRPVAWRDMAVLLRAPARKGEIYAREFARLDIPLEVARGNFFQTLEVTDLLSVLQLLDNPLQDLPLLAVLRSPLVGLSVEEMARIRLVEVKVRYWQALWKWRESSLATEHPDTLERVSLFLKRYGHWRQLARQGSLARCLEAVLDDTGYHHWLGLQPQGEQRRANLERFLALARQFDQLQRQGLYRFLRYVEAQQSTGLEPDVPTVHRDNTVRLLSIHQSKGLEFPVVAVADLGKRFNFSELHAEVVFDERWGLCPQIKPPHTGKRYPSLPYWMAARKQLREALGEELRLLYVAMTRSRDTLLLTAQISRRKFENILSQRSGNLITSLLKARCYADWLGTWFAHHLEAGETEKTCGRIGGLAWEVHPDTALVLPETAGPEPALAKSEPLLDPVLQQEWERVLNWSYPFGPAVTQPAKTSVSALRHQCEGFEEFRSPILPVLSLTDSAALPAKRGEARVGSGVDVGTAHHVFLQHLDLGEVGSLSALKREADRLQRAGLLTEGQVTLLDLRAIRAFWSAELGHELLTQSSNLRRELAFTARFEVNEVASIAGTAPQPALQHEFVVVQGVVDLAVILPGEIWILDFKTDAVPEEEIAARAGVYHPQLELYRRALRRIYGRPVSRAWLYFLSAGATVPVPAQEHTREL